MYNYFSAILALAFLFASFSNLKAQSSIETEIDNRLHIADSLRRRIKFSDAWNQLALISSLEEKMSNTQLAEYYK